MITSIESYSAWRKGQLQTNSLTPGKAAVAAGVGSAVGLGIVKLIGKFRETSAVGKMIAKEPDTWIKQLRDMAADLKRLTKDKDELDDAEITIKELDDAEKEFKDSGKLKSGTARSLATSLKWLAKSIKKLDQETANKWAQRLLPICQRCESK